MDDRYAGAWPAMSRASRDTHLLISASAPRAVEAAAIPIDRALGNQTDPAFHPKALVSVVLRLEGALDGNAQILRLLLRQFRKLGADLAQMESCDFFIELFRQDVYANFIGVTIFPQIQLCQDLIRK